MNENNCSQGVLSLNNRNKIDKSAVKELAHSLGAVLTDMELESDPMADYSFCGNCNLCVDICPASAIDGKGHIDQNACRRTCYIVTRKVP